MVLALYSAEACIQRRLLKLLLAVEAQPADNSKNIAVQIDLQKLFMGGISNVWG